MRDMFGNLLFIGDTVVHADARLETDEIGLDLYEITEIGEYVAKGLLLSGEYIGETYYLEDTEKRSALILNPYKTAGAYRDEILH